MIFHLNDIPIEILRKSVKNINLRVYPPDGLVRVSVPLKANTKWIEQVLHEKSAWIQHQRERIRKNSFPIARPLQTGTYIPYQGKSYLLIVEKSDSVAIEPRGGLLYCRVNNVEDAERVALALENWYQKQMASVVQEHMQRWPPIIGVTVNGWKIKTMKTRWGSCNTRTANINLNLNLIKKHPSSLEYVVVHELIHLLEPSHNSRFYQLMQQFLPDWRERQLLLENNVG